MGGNEPVTSGQVLGFYLLPHPPGYLALGSLPDHMSRVKPGVVGRVLALGQTGRAQLPSGFGPGLGRWGAGLLGAQVRAALGPQPRGGGRAPPAPCSLCCSCRPPEGANQPQPVVGPDTVISAAPQGSAAPTRAPKVQHAGSLGRARRLEQRPGPARGERGGDSAARRPSREPLPDFSWSDAVPGSLIPMHRLILVYTLVCANFCSYRDASAAPQSASIRALRNANIRRDGKRLRF